MKLKFNTEKLFLVILLLLASTKAISQIDPGVDFNLNGYINSRLDAGETTVVVPSGRYRVSPTGNTHLSFSNRNNVTIIADGVEMICTETVQAVKIENCNKFKIQGLSVDFDPLPFTQGEIVAISSDMKTLTVDLIEGYSSTVKGGSLEIFDAVTGELSTATYYGTTYQINTQTRRVIVTKPARNWDKMLEKVGDIAVMGSINTRKIPHGIMMNNCTGLELENVTLYAGTSFGFFETYCSGSTYINCKVDRRPLETDVRAYRMRRMRSNNADGFHSKFSKAGPKYIGCIARYNGDDCFAINGHFHVITKTKGAVLTVVGREGKTPDLNVNDEVELVSYSGKRIPGAKILKFEKGRALNAQEINFLQNQTFYGSVSNTYTASNVYYVTIDRSIDLPMGSLINSANGIGNGFEIRDCTIGPSRSRGLLIQASHGIITDNTFVGSWSQALKLAPEYGWLAAGSGSDVTISDNTFLGSRGSAIAVYAKGGDGSTPSAGAHDDIRIIRNTISGSINPGIAVTATSNLCMQDNVISAPNNELRVPSNSSFGTTEDPNREIYLENVSEVDCNTSVGIPNQEISSVNVYPNPVVDNFVHLKLNQTDSNQKIEIFDAMGKLMYSKKAFNETEISIDVSRYRKGMYFIKVQKNGKVDSSRILIK